MRTATGEFDALRRTYGVAAVERAVEDAPHRSLQTSSHVAAPPWRYGAGRPNGARMPRNVRHDFPGDSDCRGRSRGIRRSPAPGRLSIDREPARASAHGE